MVTLVGTQSEFNDALYELLELEYDALEAYKVAIDRLEDPMYRNQLAEYKADHERHIRELTTLLHQHCVTVPKGPSSKQWLAKGKIVLADLIGDYTILAAMRSNEEDTNTAYERINNHANQWPDALAIISRAREDEKHHKAWLDSVLSS